MALLLGVVGIYGVIAYSRFATQARDRHSHGARARSSRFSPTCFVRHGLWLTGNRCRLRVLPPAIILMRLDVLPALQGQPGAIP